jgi:hypothetical protein
METPSHEATSWTAPVDPPLSPAPTAPLSTPPAPGTPAVGTGFAATKLAAPPVDSAGQPATPEPVSRQVRVSGVAVDGSVYRGRGDDDAITGRFCTVVSGEHQGRYGVLQNTATLTANGWPELVVVRTRDAEDENLVVRYEDIRPAQAGRR